MLMNCLSMLVATMLSVAVVVVDGGAGDGAVVAASFAGRSPSRTGC